MTEPAALEGVESGKVIWRVLAASQDTNDPDRQPNFGAFRGSVVFRASRPWIRRLSPVAYTIFLDDVQGEVGDDGILRDLSGEEGVVLISPFATGIEETGWDWTASFQLNQRTKVSFPFQFQPNEVVDLSEETPIVSSPGTVFTKGLKGDPGPVGPTGPGVPAGGAANDVILHNGTTTEWRNSTPVATPLTLARRDSSGRMQVVDGSATADAVTKGQLDTANTANRARANHTGSQTASTISDLTEAVQDIVGAFLKAGTNVTVTYDDVANTFTINSLGGSGGSTDAEVVRDTIGSALVAGSGVQITLSDAADTITIAGVAASTAAPGVIELADNPESLAGVDTVRAMTPAAVAAYVDQEISKVNLVDQQVIPARIFQASNGTWAARTTVTTDTLRSVDWVGYPGLNTPPTIGGAGGAGTRDFFVRRDLS